MSLQEYSALNTCYYTWNHIVYHTSNIVHHLIRFPNCKINLGLHISGKREDGYHNLETVFYPVPICDALEILPLYNDSNAPYFTLSGLPVSGDANNNLCMKAWQLLKADFPKLSAVNIHLHKAIPMGAGLGGGSADGAFMLMMLNEKFNLGLSAERLARYALQLGSDCPFFIYNKPCFAAGRGEIIEPINISLSGYYFYIINPNIHINTGEAFRQLQYQNHTESLRDIIQQPPEQWKQVLHNDFEKGIVSQYPVVGNLIEQLHQHGAEYAAMSGSGSTVFGIFKNKPEALLLPADYFARIVAAN